MRADRPVDLDPAQRVLCDLMAERLFGREIDLGEEPDWPKILRESYLQGVQMLMAQASTGNGIPAELLEKTKRDLYARMLRDGQICRAHSEIHRIMTRNELPYVILKGVASARYYPDPYQRSMGDVDLLVRKEDTERVLRVLQSEGYDLLEKDHICHAVLQRSDVRFELHFEPAGMPDGDLRLLMESYLLDLPETATVHTAPPATCVCPSDFHHGLILLMHTQHHLLSEGIGLRHLCDWAVFVGHVEGEGFADLFRERLKRVGLWKMARLLSIACSLYLGLPERDWMEISKEDRSTAERLIEDVFKGGNFGVKDPQRAYEGHFISDRGKDGVRKGRLREGFASLNRITYRLWPLTRRIPILLPIGWLVSLVHFVKRNRQRKKQGREIDALRAYRESAPRRELYKKLSLYQPEG